VELMNDKKIVLFGEIHGTREIPETLYRFFAKFAEKNDFDICLEIPRNFQSHIRDFFKKLQDYENDGRNSLEYLKIVDLIAELNLKYGRSIHIFCIDVDDTFPLKDEKDHQNVRERIMAEQIIQFSGKKKLFVVCGSLHAYKKELKFGEKIINTMGSILDNSFKEKVFSVLFFIKRGYYFNFGKKKINDDGVINKRGYDFVFLIEESTMGSFE